MTTQPDGIILTVSRGMYEHNGYRHWLRNFLEAMSTEDTTYWMRVAMVPKQDKDLNYVYLCIGGKIRYRCYYGGTASTPEGEKTFDDGRTISGKFWVLCSGPIERAPYKIKRQGFQGFRYTQKLF